MLQHNRRIRKIIGAVMIVVSAIGLLYIFVNSTFMGYHAYKDFQCVSEHSMSYEQIENNILFSYENDDAEILLYYSPKKGFYKYHLLKKKIFGTTKYKMKYGDNIEPNGFSKEIYEVDKNLSYTYVNYERDIENVDFQGCTPIYSKVEYVKYDGSKTFCYICIIDKTESGKITRNSIENNG